MFNKESYHSDNNPKQFYYGYIVAIASFIIMVVNIGAKLSFGVFFKPLLGDFGLDRITISGVASLALIIQGFLGIIMGKINDKVGPRIVLTCTGILTGIGYLLISSSGRAPAIAAIARIQALRSSPICLSRNR